MLRERKEDGEAARSAGLSEKQWSDVKARRGKAQACRAALIEEGCTLAVRQAAIERIGRARAPLARLATVREKLTELGTVPTLPANAQQRLADAIGARATAKAVEAAHTDDLDRLTSEIGLIILPLDLLRERERIEALDERRPAEEKAANDLPRRVTELERIDARVAASRKEAGIASESAIPGSGWRKRARTHLEEWRTLIAAEKRAADESLDLAREREGLDAKFTDAVEPVGIEALRIALTAIPTDAEQRLTAAGRAAMQASSKLAEALAALSGWTGSAESLAAASLPLLTEAVEHARLIDTARVALQATRDKATAAAEDGARAEAELAALRAGTALPTPEAVAAAREARDAHLADVRARLLRERSSEDGMAADELAGAVARADAIADRRDADAARVAAYTLHCAARDRAVSLGELAEAQIEAEATRLEAAEREWAALLSRVGLTRVIAPTAFAPWSLERDRVLEYAERAREAQQTHADVTAAD